MKIAIFHELSRNSGARRVAEEYGELLSDKNDIDLYYIDEEGGNHKGFRSINFFKFNEKEWKGKNWKTKLYKDTLELIKLYKLHKKIANIVNNKEYDFVFVNPSKFTQSPFILRFLKAKKVYYCQEPLRIIYDEKISKIEGVNLFSKIYEKINRVKRKYMDVSNIKKADLILCNSEFSKNNIKKAYGINALVCYLGVDPDVFRRQNSIKHNDLLFIGDKSKLEGYNLLEKTIKLFKKRLSVRVIINGERSLTDKQLAYEYNNTKITLVLSRNEPFGLIPLESMACGVPVIALDEGGLRESVISGKTGYLIKYDENDVREKIGILLSNKQLLEKFGKAGRELVLSKFTWEKSADNFIKLVKKNLKYE